ncbi:MAG: hypothetical protein HZC36_13040 [Armatimonadetes bacterium]|nr:hypothetical protein [Armatimonadota bacterium]
MVLSLTAAILALALQQTQTIKIFVVGYYPVVGDQIDKTVATEEAYNASVRAGGGYAGLKAKTDRLTKEACAALEEGSRFRGYKLPSKPALKYEVVGEMVIKEGIPIRAKKGQIGAAADLWHPSGVQDLGRSRTRGVASLNPGLLSLTPAGSFLRNPERSEDEPLLDYNAVMKRIDAKTWVEKKGVKQIWMWGYHGKNGLWESNMSSPTGDVSNSDRDETDLPVFSKTYTVFHFNYGRELGEMLENHMHQLEHLINHIDGRDTAPPEKWPELLFWGNFVGSDISHKIVTKPAHCGWTHYAPNSESDYDWTNPRTVETDIEDWKPDGGGKTQMMSADRWGREPIKWRIYWMQAIPGLNHGLTYKGKKLRNWWSFVAEWDRAKREKWTLLER